MPLDMLILETTKVEILPIKGITVFHDSEFTNFMRVEQESSYRITPITRKTDTGGNKTVAYTVELTIYVPHTVYKKYGADLEYDEEDEDASAYLIDRLNKLSKVKDGVQVLLQLGSGTFNPGDMPTGYINNQTSGITINFTPGLVMNYEIESVEFRPRTILHFNGVAHWTLGTDGIIEMSGSVLQVNVY